jgi:hypothetical protein
MRDTPYATELASAADKDGNRIERLYVKSLHQEEVRFSWWKDGKLIPRPLNLSENALLDLMRLAIARGVFKDAFLDGLHKILTDHSATRTG